MEQNTLIKRNAETLISEIKDEIEYVERYLGKLKVKVNELETMINCFRDGNE